MKLRKIILGSAALIAGSLLSAQNLSFHGYMDYTNFGIGQQINKLNKDADWDSTDPSAEYGSFYNGRTELRVEGGIGPVSFQTGVRLDSSLGEWYNLYKDVTDETETMFHVANIRVAMLQDQLVLHAGKFEEWNCGFLADTNGISWLAMRDFGLHMTGLEWIPNMSVLNGKLVGFRLFVGLPVLPPSSKYDWEEANEWSTLWHKAKIMAAYKWLRPNITFYTGYHNEYYTGFGDDWAYETNYTESYYREAFLQADMPSLVRNLKLVATYDIKWRTAEYDYPVDETTDATFEKTTFAHYGSISGSTNIFPAWPITFAERFFYTGDHYVGKNEKAIMNDITAGVSHKIPGTSYSFGTGLTFKYAKDANGTAIQAWDAYAPNNESHCNGLEDFHTEWMAGPQVNTKGASTQYIGLYASPYFQKDFSNGYFQVAVEMQYMNVSSDIVDAQGFSYRVPFKFCFWF